MIQGIHYETGEVISLQIEQGTISSITVTSEPASILQNSLPYLAPGLIDLQINGYQGEDFNQLPITEQSIKRFCKHMWSLGVTRFFPTLITNSFAAIQEALVVIAKVCDESEAIHWSIAGIHLEGPFISPHDGARGAHDQQYVCAPNIEWLQQWQKTSGNRIKIVTLSPEWEESIAFIEFCQDNGIVASLGHTSASSAQIAAATRAGATMITHFGNGVHLQLPRHPNYLWEQLAQDELYACVIADSYHLPDQVLKIVHKVKRDKTILVSDAVALSGSKAGQYTTFVGGQVILTEAGKLHLAHNEQLLAGSVAMLKEGIRYLYEAGIVDFEEAWRMASVNAATLLALPNQAGLEVGAPADITLFHKDKDGHISINETFVAGQIKYKKAAFETNE
ncbi:MAG TPA: N-acetylglucosamine-6-phosphate deacetylase [Candidatus Paenibacillus intestinavium]|nr:N-acetylglucosamine-6-phosphate deacetylase [Candidatus Paenibacillus intestinavium]